jgi:hypothetical protein
MSHYSTIVCACIYVIYTTRIYPARLFEDNILVAPQICSGSHLLSYLRLAWICLCHVHRLPVIARRIPVNPGFFPLNHHVHGRQPHILHIINHYTSMVYELDCFFADFSVAYEISHYEPIQTSSGSLQTPRWWPKPRQEAWRHNLLPSRL